MSDSPSRRPLHERSNSQSNTQSTIRLIPKTPPRLLGAGGLPRDEIYSRTPLPTLPSHFLGPGKAKVSAPPPPPPLPVLTPVSDDEFQRATKAQLSPALSGSTSSTGYHDSEFGTSATGSPTAKPKLPAKKRLHIHKDNKTFSLLKDEPVSPQESAPENARSPRSPSILLAQQKSSDSLVADASNAEGGSNIIASCIPSVPASSYVPATPAPVKKELPVAADPVNRSPWNYQLVGGLRKVPKTPDLKGKSVPDDSPIPPPLPSTNSRRSSDEPPPPPPSHPSHDLATKPSFRSTGTVQSTETATTTSENTNYKVYGDASSSNSDGALVHPSYDDSNYELLGSPSPTGSVIYRPQTAPSEDEDENYELYGSSSPLTSPETAQPGKKYSQESLVVAPLKPRAKRSNENFGYYKQRSRETLRTGSLTSISTVLSQQEAYKAIVASGSLINLPILASKVSKPRGESSSWAQPHPPLPVTFNPPRSHMNEHPHVWSSQLSTVLSESDGGTDRDSRSWSDERGRRRSSGFPSTQSRHSRQVMSISSSLAAEEAALERSRSESLSLEPPSAAFARNGRHHSQSSIRHIGDQDEYGDGITDMQDLRTRPSRTRLNSTGPYSLSSSDNGRTSTMRSTASSRANSLLAASIPQWARLYYGSGERRGIGAPGSSIEGTDSRVSSFRSGSPNTDHFPLGIYSPRRRPREGLAQQGQGSRDSMAITPAPQRDSQGRIMQERYSRRLRTWSMSSMWSPHLRHDRRAINRSAWVPPSVTWSTEGGAFGRRNIQVVMFIMGFIFPFAWMIAAFLPLPPNPMREMRERDTSTSNLDSSNEAVNEYARHVRPMDEARYESARWWRQLNRIMSFIGMLIIGTIITLVVVGLKQRW